jgi:hypothetical protein
MMFDCGLQNIFRLKNGQSRSINWENRNGEKGKGGMASSDLGPSRKGSPCIPKIEAGETVTLGKIQGEGVIQHIWITVTDRTSERNRYVLRDLVLRMYWDDEEDPSVECPLGDFFCCGFGVSYQVNSVPVHAQDKIPQNITVTFTGTVCNGDPDVLNHAFSLDLTKCYGLSCFYFRDTRGTFSGRTKIAGCHAAFSFFSVPVFPVDGTGLSVFQPENIL